jgi:hypothetical protein
MNRVSRDKLIEVLNKDLSGNIVLVNREGNVISNIEYVSVVDRYEDKLYIRLDNADEDAMSINHENLYDIEQCRGYVKITV